eukprot:3409258-Rhodomonas_salina.2
MAGIRGAVMAMVGAKKWSRRRQVSAGPFVSRFRGFRSLVQHHSDEEHPHGEEAGVDPLLAVLTSSMMLYAIPGTGIAEVVRCPVLTMRKVVCDAWYRDRVWCYMRCPVLRSRMVLCVAWY